MNIKVKTPINSGLLTVVLIVLCLMIPVTAALLISKDHASNEFTFGYNESHIEERFGSYTEFEAGKSYEKRVAVRNDGSVPCYVRVFAEIEDPDAAKAISIDFDISNWTAKQADGYYYYKKVLAVSETTLPLFTTLSVEKEISDFSMICYSETVQAYGAKDAADAFDRL